MILGKKVKENLWLRGVGQGLPGAVFYNTRWHPARGNERETSRNGILTQKRGHRNELGLSEVLQFQDYFA